MSPIARPIGVSTWVWTSPLTDASLASLAVKAAAFGFDVLELPLETPGDFDPRLAADVLSSEGLTATTCLVTSPGRELVAADAATITGTQDYLRRCIEVAVTVGATVVGGPAYASVGRTWRVSPAQRVGLLEELRANLAPVVQEAAAAGVRIALEPLNRYETSVVNTVEEALDVVTDLPPAGCGLLLDTYHLNIEEDDIVAAILRAGERVVGVQASENHRGAPGSGHIDWRAVLDALDTIAYTGPLCIESFTVENEAIATAASIWRRLAPTQDDLARQGLATLRALGVT